MSAERIGRMTILAVTVLVVFSFMVTYMPPALKTIVYSGTTNIGQPDPYNKWNSASMLGWNYSKSSSKLLNTSYYDATHNLVQFKIDLANNIIIDGAFVRISTWYYSEDDLYFAAGAGTSFDFSYTRIHWDDILNNIMPNNPNASQFTVYGTAGTPYNFFITYNEHYYTSLQSAWIAGYLNVTIGLAPPTLSSTNALTLITQLLFFQLPNINPALNVIIATPLWVLIIYLTYRFVIAVIPFIAGF